MTNPRLRSKKLVYPALPIHTYLLKKQGLPKTWHQVLGDCDYSAIVSGMSGSGKDAVTGHIMNIDQLYGRTVIILDMKMEYPLSIFCQMDPILRHILINNGLVGRGYKVNLWLPYVQGMRENTHFKELLNFHHPNLTIRPFRINKSKLVSEDSANMAMSKSQLQSMADKNSKLSGTTRMLNELREHMAKMKMAFDDDDSIWSEGCGWEYIDFDQMSSNGQVNVISTFFMMGINVVAATSFMIGILNELMTIGKGVHRYRQESEIFTIVIPEVQVIMPKGVKSLEQIVNTLQYSMLVGMLLMRSFDTRLRINLQNMSSLPPSLMSQSRIFSGRTRNPKDLALFSMFGIKRKEWGIIQHLKTGDFIDVIEKIKFNAIPFCHKARAREPLVKMLGIYQNYPSLFLYETDSMLYSEAVDFWHFFERRPITVSEYDRRVKAWISKQMPLELAELPKNTDPDLLTDDKTIAELKTKGVI